MENQAIQLRVYSNEYIQENSGFGRISKFAMSDTSLSIESKTIYAYMCSYAGTHKEAYPKVATILKDLNIEKKRFYNHVKPLLKHGYISIKKVKSEKGRFRHNVYVIESTPKKYLGEPISEKEKEIFDNIRQQGIQGIYYGTLMQGIMRDDRLDITGKGIYAYFCSYAGNEKEAFPLVNNIVFHLKISRKRYYKYFHQLLELGYITTYTVRKGMTNQKRYVINDYWHNTYCTNAPVIDNTLNRTILNGTILNGTILNAPTKIKKPESNSPNIKIRENHQLGSVDSTKIPNNFRLIDLSDKNNFTDYILKEMLEHKGIPQWFTNHHLAMDTAVSILAGNQHFMDSDKEHKLVLAAISQMAATPSHNSKYGDMLNEFNKSILFDGDSLSFAWLPDFEREHSYTLATRNIENIIGYTKTSIYNFLKNYSNGSASNSTLYRNADNDYSDASLKDVITGMLNRQEQRQLSDEYDPQKCIARLLNQD